MPQHLPTCRCNYCQIVHTTHAHLLQDRAVHPDLARERGYFSIEGPTLGHWEQLQFSTGQRRAGLVIPLHPLRPNARTARHVLRPDIPKVDANGKMMKYVTPLASEARLLDCPPRMRPLLAEASVPLLVTEGPLKADAAAGHGLCCVALLGVGTWRCDDWEEVALRGRDVHVVFDSDMLTNRDVRRQGTRLADFLRGRGARVYTTWLPDHPELGTKLGLDDWLALRPEPERYRPDVMADLVALSERYDPASDRKLVSVSLATVQPEAVGWLWDRWLPRGKLVVLDGDPEVGKSTLMCDVTARITTGSPWPDEPAPGTRRHPASVVWMTAEDGLADTLRPRLEAAGADLTRVEALTAVRCRDERGDEHERLPTLPDDVDLLEQRVLDAGACLVVVDVLMAYLHQRVNSWSDQSVRGVLSRLARMAEDTGSTIVFLRHLKKSRDEKALYRGGGSIGIVGAARVGWAAGLDPEDPTGDRRILAQQKNNLSPKPTSLAYRIAGYPAYDCGCVQWLGPSSLTAEQVVQPEERPADDGRLAEARQWLLDVLTGGPMAYQEVQRYAAKEGIARATLQRAADELLVVKARDENVRGRPSTWSLPGLLTTEPRSFVASDDET